MCEETEMIPKNRATHESALSFQENLRFMLAFRAQDELEALVGCVGRAMPRTLKRIQPRRLTRHEREIRTEKLQGG